MSFLIKGIDTPLAKLNYATSRRTMTSVSVDSPDIAKPYAKLK